MSVNVAVHVEREFRTICVVAEVVAQFPDQPEKVELPLAVAVRAMVLPTT